MIKYKQKKYNRHKLYRKPRIKRQRRLAVLHKSKSKLRALFKMLSGVEAIFSTSINPIHIQRSGLYSNLCGEEI